MHFDFFRVRRLGKLSFFTNELQDSKRDLKWVYFGSFVLVSIFYLALSGAMTGLASKGQSFGIQEGFLSLLPQGLIRGCSPLILINVGLFVLIQLVSKRRANLSSVTNNAMHSRLA